MCPAVERIDLTKAGNLCSESSSMVGMTCQVTMIVAITLAITTLAITLSSITVAITLAITVTMTMCRAPGTRRR